MSRKEIMQAIKEVTGNRHFVHYYGDGRLNPIDKLSDSIAYDLNRNIDAARFCYRNRISLEAV